MTIQVNNLTVTVSISGSYGSETYEVLSVRDQHGDELGAVSVFLLDEIEEP